jgi:geranylgeranyl diphosphate synthase type 3
MEPYNYIEHVQGKGIRDMLIDAFNSWFKVGFAELARIKHVVRMLHNASLLYVSSTRLRPMDALLVGRVTNTKISPFRIDDIEDNSKMRRGVPVAHSIYGIPTTINCSNYAYFLALEEVHNMGNAEAVKVFIDELLNLHRGQGWDIYWRDSNQCPEEAQYKQMVIDSMSFEYFSTHSPMHRLT